MNAKTKEKIILAVIIGILAYAVYICAEDFFNEVFKDIAALIDGLFSMDISLNSEPPIEVNNPFAE